tara:strand:+ start:224 stop:1282 length:1059 start_codon:yes stop_codon:yes gene_type:complete
MKSSKKIAIVGAGVFGSTIALRLSSNNYHCFLYEEKKDILLGASRVNQYRFHRGYHYPRSLKTVSQLKVTIPLFIDEYGDTVDSSFENLYGIAKDNSHVDEKTYIEFLEKCNLKYSITNKFNNLLTEKVPFIVQVEEGLINYKRLKQTISERIKNQSNLNLKLNTKFTKDLLKEYDYVIICGYGTCQELLPIELINKYKYQLIEKIVITPPKELENISLVIIDGPFMCIDPLLGTSYSILGNVVNAIHSTSISDKVPESFYNNNNIKLWDDISDIEKSRFKTFVNHGNEYIKFFDKSKFEYSMRGIRVIKRNVESTDERTTVLRKSGKIIDVFSGKLDTCSWAANQVLKLIE